MRYVYLNTLRYCPTTSMEAVLIYAPREKAQGSPFPYTPANGDTTKRFHLCTYNLWEMVSHRFVMVISLVVRK